jgi:hypothetical protein
VRLNYYPIRYLLLALAIVWSGTAGQGAVFHVSPSGSDGNPGNRSKPFASLSRAIAASHEVPPSRARRIVVHGGEYFEVAVVLDPRDSGLVIEGASDGEPVLYGGRRIEGFKSDGGPLSALDLPGK